MIKKLTIVRTVKTVKMKVKKPVDHLQKKQIKNHRKQMTKNQNKKVKHQRKAKNRKVKFKLNLHNKHGNLDSSLDKNRQSKQKKPLSLLKPW